MNGTSLEILMLTLLSSFISVFPSCWAELQVTHLELQVVILPHVFLWIDMIGRCPPESIIKVYDHNYVYSNGLLQK